MYVHQAGGFVFVIKRAAEEDGRRHFLASPAGTFKDFN